MKTKLLIPLIALCGALATPSVFAQSVDIWTGAGDGTNIDAAANWLSNAVPSAFSTDTAEFNGTQPGNLSLVYNDGANGWPGNYQSAGITLYMNTNQTGSVTVGTTRPTSPAWAYTGFTVDPGAGALTVGGPDASHILAIIGRPGGIVHPFINNSANTATITPYIVWTSGGGATWTADFSGTGNWQVGSYFNNNNSGANIIQVDGPGTVYWNIPADAFKGSQPLGNPVINGGALVMQSGNSLLNNVGWALNGGMLVFDAPSVSQTLSGVITGTSGSLWVSDGTLLLSGASTYNGGTYLTNNGVLVANGTENQLGGTGPLGSGGTIYFNGGTLQYSSKDTADYSSRFSTSDNQSFKINTAGFNVEYASDPDLTSTGGTLTKLGGGSLTLDYDAGYTGGTTVSGGKLVLDGTIPGTGNITVDDGAAFGVTEYNYFTSSALTPITPATLTLGQTSGCTLEFNNVGDLGTGSTAPIQAGTLVSAGTVTININSGTFETVGQVFPLFSWTSGAPPAVALGILNGANGELVTNANNKEIDLKITQAALIWAGNQSGIWDHSTANWTLGGVASTFSDGDIALFSDAAYGYTTTITINGVVLPQSVTVNNNASSGVADYSIASSSGNDIGGTTGLSKQNTGTLTLSGGANTYTGPTTLSGGTVSVGTLADGGSPSDIGASDNSAANLVFDGGALQYTGPGISSDRSFTLGTGGGTIDASGTGALILDNAGPAVIAGSGPRTLILTGTTVTNNTLSASLADGTGGLTVALDKEGAGTWIVTGTNSFTGTTTVGGGTLQVGNGGTTGAIGTGSVVDNGTLLVNRSSSMTIGGAISGSGYLTQAGPGALTLTGNNSYSGGTTISNGATLQVGTGGYSGTLNAGANITDNGTFIFNSRIPLAINGYLIGITGTGNVIVQSGFLSSFTYNTYTGWTLIDPGATFQPCQGNTGNLNSSVVTNNGTLLFLRQDYGVFVYSNNIVGSGKVVKDNNNQNDGDITLAGTNTYTGGTWIGGGRIVVGGYGVTTILTNVTATTTNYVTNTAYVPGGTIVGNVYFTNTISAFNNPRQLIFNYDNDVTFPGSILNVVNNDPVSGAAALLGSVTTEGSGVLTLTGNNTYTVGTTVSNGVLQVGNGGTSGTLGSGPVSILNANCGLVFDRSDNYVFTNDISGAGYFVQDGPGTLTLTSTNLTYTGDTTISNGMLVVTAGTLPSLNVNVDGGMLAPAAPGTVGTLNIPTGTLNINSGGVLFTLDGATNSAFIGSALVPSAQPGTVVKLIVNSPLTVGTYYQLFPGPVSGGDTMQIVSTAGGFENDLATGGYLYVTNASPGTFTQTPKVTQFSMSGGNVQITGSQAESGAAYYLLTSTNAALPLSQWTPVATNAIYTANGNFTFNGTNVVTSGVGQQFYILSNTNN